MTRCSEQEGGARGMVMIRKRGKKGPFPITPHSLVFPMFRFPELTSSDDVIRCCMFFL